MLRITIPKQRHSNRESKAANHVAIIYVKNNYWKEKNNALKPEKIFNLGRSHTMGW